MATGNPGRRYIFLGRMLLTVGMISFVVGSVLSIREALFLRNSLQVQGEYTDEAGEEDSHGNMNFVYFIDFQSREGRKVTFTAYTQNHELPEHKPVLIRYDPNHPTSARLASEPSPSSPLLFITMGLGLAAVGGGVSRAEHRKQTLAFDAPIPEA